MSRGLRKRRADECAEGVNQAAIIDNMTASIHQMKIQWNFVFYIFIDYEFHLNLFIFFSKEKCMTQFEPPASDMYKYLQNTSSGGGGHRHEFDMSVRPIFRTIVCHFTSLRMRKWEIECNFSSIYLQCQMCQPQWPRAVRVHMIYTLFGFRLSHVQNNFHAQNFPEKIIIEIMCFLLFSSHWAHSICSNIFVNAPVSRSRSFVLKPE